MSSASRPGRAIVLGSGAGGGVPQWNCGCQICALARAGDTRVRASSQASLAVTGDGEHWLVINAAPDIRAQLSACPALWPPEGRRGTPVTDILLTGGEIDQIGGLLTLREGQGFVLHASEGVHATLAANPVFHVLAPGIVRREIVRPPDSAQIAGLDVEVVPLPGKAPLYLEDEEGAEGGPDATLAVLARPIGGGLALAYVPGCAVATPELHAMLERADIVLMDGTVYHDDDLVRAGLGTKTGRRMGHLPMSGFGGTLDLLEALAPRRRLYTHLNNTNPVLLAGSPERADVEARGIEIAQDGLEIGL